MPLFIDYLHLFYIAFYVHHHISMESINYNRFYIAQLFIVVIHAFALFKKSSKFIHQSSNQLPISQAKENAHIQIMTRN